MPEKVYEELDDAKAKIEKLRSEYHVKASLCDNLKRSYDDQVKRIQELNLKLEKQAQEVEVKSEEAYAAKQSLEDLKCKLKEKECIIKSFNSSNDKLRADFNSKLRESEEEKRELVSLLEEANVKILNLEHENRAFMDKIEVLKEGILSVSQKKCASESKIAKASKQMREKGDMFEKLEEDKVKLEEQLKWKKEQFKHLEEAHEKLRDNLRTKEKEWDMEKCTFLDDISALETKLDSQIRLSEDLKRRLEMSNQALAHEENQRKCLTNEIDKDVATFRNLLCEKEGVCKDMAYKISKLEEENQELVLSLKELRESQIREATNSPSVAKLRNKLKTLEQIHSDCSHHSKLREAEWSSRFEKVVADLNSCRLELESKEARLEEITAELGDYNSLVLQLTMEKEESALMMVAMKSTLLEARSKIHEEKVLVSMKELESMNRDLVKDLNSCRLELESKEARLKEITPELSDYDSLVLQLTMEKEESALMMVAMKSTLLEARSKIDEEKVLVLMKELESMNRDLFKAQETIKEQHAEIESLKMVKEEKLLLHKEIDSHEAQLLHTKSELNNVCDLLDRANEELAQSCCEANEVEFELQIWKSVAKNLEVSLEQNHEMRKEVEASLLAQVATEVNLKQEICNLASALEEKGRRINDLEQKLKESKKDTVLQFAKENGEELEKEIEWWGREWVTKELEAAILAQLESERIHEHEKQSLNQLVEEKEQRINNLQEIMRSLEEDFDHSTASFSSQLAKMQAEMNLFLEAWEKIRTTVVLKEIEVQEKDLMIVELEKDLEKQVAFEKKCLSKVKKLSSENLDLMGIIGGVSERINKLSREDGQMMGTLRSIILSFDEKHERMELKDHFDPMKENTNVYQSPKRNMVENSLDERSPLRALNG